MRIYTYPYLEVTLYLTPGQAMADARRKLRQRKAPPGCRVWATSIPGAGPPMYAARCRVPGSPVLQVCYSGTQTARTVLATVANWRAGTNPPQGSPSL